MIGMTGYIYDDNDDMAALLDNILERLSINIKYIDKDDDEWMSAVNHQDMEDAIRDMSPTEQEIIRKFFIDSKSLLDISVDLDLPMDMIGGYITMMETRIRIWM